MGTRSRDEGPRRGRGRPARSDHVSWARHALATALVLSMVAVGGASGAMHPGPGTADDVPGAALRFVPSGIKAGGFYTSVAMPPGGSDTVILGGGNSGYHRFTDLGASFQARNRGLVSLPRMRVASLAYHPTRHGVVFGATGSRGRDGGFARSTDDGLTWEVLSTDPLFAGQDNRGIADLPEHPRSTGNLIAAHEDTHWAGTFQQGVMRSRDGGRTWDVIGLAGSFIRSLVRHPSDPATLYVALWKGGVLVTRDALDDIVTFTSSAGAPATVEELAFVGHTLYAAGGTAGLFRLEADGWVALAAGVPRGADWTAIAGVETGEAHILFAGCSACGRDREGHLATVIRSTDGGASWHNATTPASLDFRVVGSGERWAMADAVPGYMPGAARAMVSQLLARRGTGEDPDAVLVLMAGRGGLWRSLDSGSTWAPAVNGLSETNSEGLAIDPADPRRIFQGASHFGLQVSTDTFESVHVDALSSIPLLADREHPSAFSAAFDTTETPSTVIIAAGDSDDARVGGVYLSRDPFTRDGWEDLGFTAQVPDAQPTSLAVGHDPAGRRVIVAAVRPRGGLVRKVGDGQWLRVAGTPAFTRRSPAGSQMLWVRDTGVVFVYDLSHGLYRSTDAGLTFQELWAHPSEAPGTGGLTGGANDPGVLYVAAEDGLFRLDGADAGSVAGGEVAVTRIGPERRVADAFLDATGILWAVAHPGPDEPTKVLMIDAPGASDPRVIELTDETLANTMVAPTTLVVAHDGTVLVGGLRSGTLRGIVPHP